MHSDTRIYGEPVEDFLLLVGRVVVQHQAQLLIGISPGDVLEEGQEFLMTVTRFAHPGDLAGRDVQGGEQRGGAVADVVVGLAFRHPDLHRQGGRGAIQGLDLALLIDAEHDRVLGGSR